MREFFKNSGLKVLIVTMIVILAVLAYSFFSGNSLLSSVIGFVTTPMQQLSNNIAGKIDKVSVGGKTLDQLEAENAELQKKLDQMIALTVDYYNIKRENEQNVKYLELKARKKDYQFTPASVIGRDPTDVFYGFTLDQGSLVGISKYDPVITDRGLVGWVSSVYPTYCKLTTIFSPDTNVSVIDQVSRDTGVVIGNIAHADRGEVKMNFITGQNNIKPGDIVITSGIGGIYPGDLPLGEVLSIVQDPNSYEISAVIKPYENIKEVRNVFVITDFLGQGDTIPADLTVGSFEGN